jgi:hypothetical protein
VAAEAEKLQAGIVLSFAKNLQKKRSMNIRAVSFAAPYRHFDGPRDRANIAARASDVLR